MTAVRRLAVPFAVAVLAVLGTACGGGGDSTGAAPQGSPAETAANTPGTGTLVMKDNEFVPSDFTIRAGIRITLQNEGQNPHNLSVEGQSFDYDVHPGETETEDLELPAGTYQIFCKFHRSVGMTGTLTVEG